MPALSDVTGRFVYNERINSAKQVFTDVKNQGVVQAAIGLGQRFGSSNRKLLHNWLGSF